MSLIVTKLLDQKYEEFKNSAARTKRNLQGSISRMAAQPVESDLIVGLYRTLGRDKAALNVFAALSGVVQHVKDAEDNQAYDVQVEIVAVIAAIDIALAWIEANFPSSGGYLLFLQISDGDVTPRSFSVAQTSGLRTVLQAVVDTLG